MFAPCSRARLPPRVSSSSAAPPRPSACCALPDAASMAATWTASDDVRTWTFELDTEATFDDGTPITAADVELSLERVVSLGSSSLTASRLDTVEGYQAFLDAGGRLAEADLAGIEATGEATVEIRLSRPEEVVPLVARLRGIPGVETVEAWGYTPTAPTRPGEVDVVRTYPDGGHGAFALRAPPATTRTRRIGSARPSLAAS